MNDDLASLMADEPERGYIEQEARNEFRAKVRPLIAEQEAREQALLARVAELEALLASLYAPIQTTFGATLDR